jgi:tRNA dimethylallyltransferase
MYHDHVMQYQNLPVIVLLGPTGAGKTSVAMELARALPVELICMDSMQVYGELSIGNTAPAEQEKRMVPHHLFGTETIRKVLTSGDWLAQAKSAMTSIHRTGRIPLFVGGTGLYYKLLTEGLSDLPKTPPEIRTRLDRLFIQHGLPHLYRILTKLDPETARNVHPNDRQRVQRFLEVRLLTGKSVSTLWHKGKHNGISNPMFTIGLSMDRGLLVSRIRKRLNEMLLANWIEEAVTLEKKGLKSFVLERGPIGYSLIYDWLDGRNTCLSNAIERIFFATRQYAKRQMTWFRSISDVEWFSYYSETGYNLHRMILEILEFMEIGSHQ